MSTPAYGDSPIYLSINMWPCCSAAGLVCVGPCCFAAEFIYIRLRSAAADSCAEPAYGR